MKRLVLLLLLAFVVPALAQTALPATRAGQAFEAWLSALNAADAARMKEVLAQYHMPVPPDAFMGFARQTGGFTLLKVEESSDNALTAIVAERAGDTIVRASLTLIVDAGGQVTKGALGLRAFPREGELAIPRLTEAAALKALEDRAAAAEKDDKFSGVYLIARNGKVLAAKAFGWEDREAKRKATLQTKFRMGSMNKMFTAVATLQLVEAKKLSLSGTVGQYIPDYPNREVAEKVTIGHLLAHTGGTGDFFGPQFDANRLTLKTHGDYMVLFGARAPQFAPGSRFAYSNYGYQLLGNIIEKVSGMTYYGYVARNIFAPAGMTGTASQPEEEAVANRAKAYMQKEGWVPAADTLPYRGTSAGGGYTTAQDLLRFARALQSEKLLPGRLVADAATPHNSAGGYGYGFSLGGKGLLQWYGHKGGAPGQNGALQVYPALGYVIIGLSNYDPPAATAMTDFFTNRMPATR
ncbi:MAG TPA: serine hydrolase domain-containing protein [Rhizomicrobium sp.]|nr:serine hydrolase domain-containing protein [Rhizomicrobium sp.]